MADAFAKINELAALLPDEQREAFKAKVRADFEVAAGITAPAKNTADRVGDKLAISSAGRLRTYA
jgi:hypothetical protein